MENTGELCVKWRAKSNQIMMGCKVISIPTTNNCYVMLEFMEETKHKTLGGFKHNFDPHRLATKDTLHEWSCLRRVKPHVHNMEYPTSWATPPAGVIKCNVDTAIFHNNSVGYGMCFRNSKDHFLMGKSAQLHSSVSFLEAKAITLLEAINTAISFGFHNVMFETDNKSLAEAINSSSTFHNELGDQIVQCRGFLTTNFDFVVPFIRRQANRVADSIVRASIILYHC